MKKTVFAMSMLLFMLFDIYSVNAEVAINVKDVMGKSHPSEDSIFTISYDNGTINIQSKKQQTNGEANVSIQDTERNIIYMCEVPLISEQTTSIHLPKDVDEEKCTMDVECEDKRLKIYF